MSLVLNNRAQGFRYMGVLRMDDLRFYVLFNSISVISGQCLDDNERLVCNGTQFMVEISP